MVISDVRTRECSRGGCHNVAYSSRSGGLCRSHAEIFTPETIGPMVPNVTVARELWQWVQQGYGYTTLFDAVGIKGISTQFDRGCSMQAATFRRLQALDVDTCRSHPAWRARRRLQALRAAGMRMQDMVRPGLSASTISKVCRGRCRLVTREVHLAAMRLYDEHKDLPVRAPVPWMRRWGWVPPLAWEDIDNPRETHGSMENIILDTVAKRFYQRHLRPVDGVPRG